MQIKLSSNEVKELKKDSNIDIWIYEKKDEE